VPQTCSEFIKTSRRLDRIYNGIIFKEHGLLDSDTFKADKLVYELYDLTPEEIAIVEDQSK
jgi:hypothetical protein